jgi:hypothetical protein
MPLHPTTPRRKFNAFNENGLTGRDTTTRPELPEPASLTLGYG